MSYCRWSSDDFSSDIYCYASCHGGYDILIAGNRVLGDIPKLPELTKENLENGTYIKADRKQGKFLENANREWITLEHAGESFNEDTAKEAADRLEYLRDLGYNVPQYAIDALREEGQTTDQEARE